MLGNNAIRTITVRGFKGIRALENLELRPLNVLIGANGAGKSNFLGVFELFRALGEDRLVEYVIRAGGANRLVHFGVKQTKRVELSVGLESYPGVSNFELLASSTDELILNSSFQGPRRGLFASRLALPYLRVFHFADAGVTSPMRGTPKIDDNAGLREDGSNLAAILYLLQERYPAELLHIRQVVQQVAPFFDDFILRPRALKPDEIRLEWRHRGSEEYFDAAALSDGTIRFIALATLLNLPTQLRPLVFLVDEPELGLHPAAITILAALLRKTSVETQVIVSTQSPQLLDEFEPEDVLVMDRVDGATQVRRLEAEPLREWLQDYSLGQLWEKNLVGGRPVSTSR